MPKVKPEPISPSSMNKWSLAGAPVKTRMLDVTDEQVEVLQNAQRAVEQAQGLLNALLLGVLTGHHLREAQVVRITDTSPHQLEVRVS